MTEPPQLYKAWFESPIGWIETGVTDSGICELFFRENKGNDEDSHPWLTECHHQLTAYFQGTLMQFTLPMAPVGTEFQLRVWKELGSIGYGKVITYRDLGIRLGGPNFTRIVGQANGKNPVSLMIPCHRVIGMNGSLTGYGGGLWRKEWLLEHEHKTAAGFTSVLF